MGQTLEAIDRLTDVSGRYGAVFCDVWGVVHDGVAQNPPAVAALAEARRGGAQVILLTNSPRPAEGVREQLDALGVPRDAYDAIVTSGDATRALISANSRRVFHIGTKRNEDLFDGLHLELLEPEQADLVVATGLFDDEAETPEDYAALLDRLAARDLPMICANPDIVVHRGERLIYCAGAIAKVYAERGQVVHLAGKPHPPIYDVARSLLPRGDVPILCIGDGMFTDVKGANTLGADCLFISDGIHRDALAEAGDDPARLAEALAREGLTARFVQPFLR
ncbi:TIGR01459 family HAD-type hydrolase [Aureimonas ureilytica]|uniref:TIGR01459 family HAD-type hydrolase n=1 Tax=Aureimonas ureilytica TaxID=401562 RepID=UPI000371D966|nr:TIGR01459 family HAD-type hydrolase [Aureimonas ureilytica]